MCWIISYRFESVFLVNKCISCCQCWIALLFLHLNMYPCRWRSSSVRQLRWDAQDRTSNRCWSGWLFRHVSHGLRRSWSFRSESLGSPQRCWFDMNFRVHICSDSIIKVPEMGKLRPNVVYQHELNDWSSWYSRWNLLQWYRIYRDVVIFWSRSVSRIRDGRASTFAEIRIR